MRWRSTVEFPYGWNLFNRNPMIEICDDSLNWFEWIWCSWMMLWVWYWCPTQQLQLWLVSFWMSHCLVRMIVHVKTSVYSGGRGSACTAQMLRMMSSTLYHADLTSFFHPLSTTITTVTVTVTITTTFFPSLMQMEFLVIFFNFLVKTLWFHCLMFRWHTCCNVLVHLISRIIYFIFQSLLLFSQYYAQQILTHFSFNILSFNFFFPLQENNFFNS